MIKKDVKMESSGSKRLTKAELEKMLIDNFVNLQRVLTNLSIKFDALSDNISKLLQLFELSAKSLAEKQGDEEGIYAAPKMDQELLNKLEVLLDQNKTIAKGLTLIEGKLRENTYNPNISLNSPEGNEIQRNSRYPED